MLLRADMAKRIMYSILPSVCDSSQIYHTQGVVDYKALSYAIEGRHNVIKYGMSACIKEINHYTKSGTEIHNELKKEFNSGNYFAIAKKATEVFADKTGWASAFGGEPWYNISNSILKMITYDEELNNINKSKNCNPNFWDCAVQVMKSLVVELNVFDGLSHNTDTIMRNLVNEEYYFTKTSSYTLEFERIKRMMDAKELTNPIDVYRIIEEELIESGDIVRYKDWTKRLRNTSDYICPADLTEEFFKINFRKINFLNIKKMNILLEKAKEKLATMYPEAPTLGDLFTHETVTLEAYTDTIARNVYYQMDLLRGKKDASSVKLFKMIDSLYDTYRSFLEKIVILRAQSTDLMKDADKIEKYNEIINHAYSLVYLIQSV